MTENSERPTDRTDRPDDVSTGEPSGRERPLRGGPGQCGRGGEVGSGRASGERVGGIRSRCSRELKTDVEVVDPDSVLDGVDSLRVSTWRYEGAGDIRHMSPMAEQFHATFGLGVDDEHIDAIDAGGVALAAIQGLSSRLDDAREAIAARERRIDRQADRIDELEGRLAALENQLDAVDPTTAGGHDTP